jgi:Flp pilus assembly protein TadD
MPLSRALCAYWLAKASAISLLVFGRTGSAEKVFDRMLLRWPKDAYALASRAHLRASRGALGPALEDSAELVAAHPHARAAYWFNHAYMLEQDGRTIDAERAFREALVLDPKLDRAWYGLGLSLIRQGRFEEAESALVRNTELQPMSPYGWYQLARVYVDRHEPEEARRVIRHLKGFEPKVAAQLERETGLAI